VTKPAWDDGDAFSDELPQHNLNTTALEHEGSIR